MTSVNERTNAYMRRRDEGFVETNSDLEVVEVSKIYDGSPAVEEVSFQLRSGEFLSLIGPSGSGKTSTLLMVAGFERPTSGDIRMGGRSVLDDPPQKRNLGVGFQSYALFPHMSVIQNVEFPLKMRGVSRAERRTRAGDILEKVGLADFAGRRPRLLSGGQQQRVSLARALVFEPTALLLDEPLGALDKRLREQMQLEIKALHARTGVSVLYVTHDQEEAMAMSDHIAVMADGKIVQMGTPDFVYHHPRTAFVAHFLGETNLFACTQQGMSGSYAQVTYGDGRRGLARPQASDQVAGRSEVLVCVRPERIEFLSGVHERENEMDVVVIDSTFLGSHTRYLVEGMGEQLVLKCSDKSEAERVRPGEHRRIGWARDHGQVLSADK